MDTPARAHHVVDRRGRVAALGDRPPDRLEQPRALRRLDHVAVESVGAARQAAGDVRGADAIVYALVHYRAWTSRSRPPRRHSETSCVPGWPTTTPVRTRPGTTRPSSTGATGSASSSRPATPASPGRRSTAAAARRMVEQALFGEEMARAKAPPPVNVLGMVMGGPGGHHPRHRRAEGALAAADPDRRGDLVPGLLGARVGLRPGLAQDQGGQVERRVDRDRPEGLDDLRPQGQVVHARRPHRPGRAQAPGPHLLHHGHGAGGGAGAPAATRSPRSRSSTSSSSRRLGSRTRTWSAGSATAGPSRSRR